MFNLRASMKSCEEAWFLDTKNLEESISRKLVAKAIATAQGLFSYMAN